jgi:hypothetical protein
MCGQLGVARIVASSASTQVKAASSEEDVARVNPDLILDISMLSCFANLILSMGRINQVIVSPSVFSCCSSKSNPVSEEREDRKNGFVLQSKRWRDLLHICYGGSHTCCKV